MFSLEEDKSATSGDHPKVTAYCASMELAYTTRSREHPYKLQIEYERARLQTTAYIPAKVSVGEDKY